jgi:acyl-coenzyme A synthetase/AMP-(fatty) acid ligase
MSISTSQPTVRESGFAPTVLTQERRDRLAGDLTVGGGNIVRSAIAANPNPALPFVRPARPLVDMDGRLLSELSLDQLDRLAQSWSAWYLEQGVRPRDRVAVYLEDSFAYWVHFYALAQIGAIALLVNSQAPRELAAHLCSRTNAVGLYTDRARLDALGSELSRLDLRWTQTCEDLPAPPAAELPEEARFRHAPDDPVCLLHSSGTTGLPKPAIHTHRSIVAGPQFRLATHTEAPGALMMTALPQSHLGCIAYTTYAILGGTPIVPLYDATGIELAAALREHQPTTVMAFAHTYAELAALDPPRGAFDSIDVWVTIADAIHEAHLKKILATRGAGHRPAAFYDRFGTTELGWGVLLHVRTLESERRDRCVGKPVGVADVAVLRHDGTKADVNEVGLLAARGPAITAGYWNDSDTTYRSRLGGYWLTGDYVYRDEEDHYFQLDRAVDVIQTADRTGYSVFMEELVLAEVPDVRDCAVVAGRDDGETVAVAVVTVASDSSGPAVDPARLLEAANRALRSAGHPELTLLEVATSEGDFPVGVTGKVLKRQLREKYSDLSTYVGDGAGRTLATTSVTVGS